MPWISNFGVEGAVQTLSGSVICTLLPPVTSCPAPLSVMGGSVVPHVCVFPLRVRLLSGPLTDRLASSQMCMVPDPWFADRLEGHVTGIVTCAPSTRLVVCGQPPPSGPPPELASLEPLDPPLEPPLLEPVEPPLLELIEPPFDPLLLEPAKPLEPPPLGPAASTTPPPLSSPRFTCELLDPLLHAPTTVAQAKRAILGELEPACGSTRFMLPFRMPVLQSCLGIGYRRLPRPERQTLVLERHAGRGVRRLHMARCHRYANVG
jgi:hypothetical protein